jgi:hypothetical protein
MKRKDGFYWVQQEPETWTIMRWNSVTEQWYNSHCSVCYKDQDLIVIDERQIERSK